MPLNIDWQQILLHLLNFVVLFAILYFLLYKPVKQFMEKRAEYYKNLDEEAKTNLAEAEKAKEEYLKKLDLVEDEIAAKRQEAHIKMEEASAAKIKLAKEEAEKIVAEAHKDIEYDRIKMMKQAKKEIRHMVTSAAEKFVAKSTTPEAFDEFLEAAKRGEDDE